MMMFIMIIVLITMTTMLLMMIVTMLTPMLTTHSGDHNWACLWSAGSLCPVCLHGLDVNAYDLSASSHSSNHCHATPANWNWFSSGCPAICLLQLGQSWDLLALCQYTVTGWGRKFDLQLLSQCSSVYNYRSRSVPRQTLLLGHEPICWWCHISATCGESAAKQYTRNKTQL